MIDFDPADFNRAMETLLKQPDLDEWVARMARALARDHDGAIREALIKLGWTPPPEKDNGQEDK